MSRERPALSKPKSPVLYVGSRQVGDVLQEQHVLSVVLMGGFTPELISNYRSRLNILKLFAPWDEQVRFAEDSTEPQFAVAKIPSHPRNLLARAY